MPAAASIQLCAEAVLKVAGARNRRPQLFGYPVRCASCGRRARIQNFAEGCREGNASLMKKARLANAGPANGGPAY